MSWLLPVLTLVLLLWVPGMVVLAAARTRPATSLLVAPAVTLGIAGLSTVALGVLDVPWRLWTAGLCTLALAAGAWVVAAVVRRRSPDTGGTAGRIGALADMRVSWPTAVGTGVAFLLAAAVLLPVIGSPSSVPQGWDIAFHTGYSQWAATTGNASPLQTGVYQNYDSGVPSFYPTAMHAVLALAITVTGQTSVVVVNAYLLVLAGLLVPLASAALAALAFPGRRWAPGTAAVLSTGFSILPYDQLWRPALPFATAVATAAMALVALHAAQRRPSLAPVAALAVVGCGSAHPSGLFYFALLASLFLVHRLVRPGPRTTRLRVSSATAAVGVLAAIGMGPQLLAALGKGEVVASYDYQLGLGARQGLLRALGFGIDVRPEVSVQIALAIVVATAVVVSATQRWARWLTVAWVALAVLTVQAAIPFWDPLTVVLTPWYNDPWRVSAMMAAVSAPLAGGALVVLTGRLLRVGAAPRRTALAGALAGLVAATLAVTNVGRNQDRMSLGYVPGPVNQSVLDGFTALRELAGTEGRVLNDPYDGSVWMYPVEGVRPVFQHYEVGTVGQDQIGLLEGIADIATDPAVQEAARRLDVHYVFVSQRRMQSIPQVPVFALLPTAPGLTQVFDNGTVSIYRIDAP